MKQETIDEIRKALEQATPGPWREEALNIWSDEDVLLLCNLGHGVRYWYDGGMRIYRKKDSEQRTFADARLIPLLRNHAPALLDEIERLRGNQKTCRWHTIDEDEMPGTYKTECGHMFSFCEGGRAENDAVYCQYCGGKIEEDEYRVKYWIYVDENYGEWRRTGLMTFDNALKVAQSLAERHHRVELYADGEEAES